MEQVSQEDIEQQKNLLQIHRNSLYHYLKQLAQHGTANTAPSTFHGIEEARQEIQRIKAVLRSWNISVKNSPNDEARINEESTSMDISFNKEVNRIGSSIIENNIRSIIIEFTCYFCRSQVGYDIVFADYSVYRNVYGDIITGIAISVLKCRQCQMYSIYNFSVIEDDHILAKDINDLQVLLSENPLIISASINPDWITYLVPAGQYPFGKNFPSDIPKEIISIIQEAGDCLSVRAINATAVMCRRVVEKLANLSGIETQRTTLVNTLTSLKSKGIIDDALFDALNEVRFWGNKSAHTIDEDIQDLDQAKEMFDLVVHAVEYAFSKSRLISKTGKLRQRRTISEK